VQLCSNRAATGDLSLAFSNLHIKEMLVQVVVFEVICSEIKVLQMYGGEGGIRTHGTSRYNGFQERYRVFCDAVALS